MALDENTEYETRNDNGKFEMKGDDIAGRLLDFAANVLRIVAQLPKGAVTRHVGLQLAEAATSGGANYEEARSAESRADFVHKTLVAAKEISESVYWLRLIERAALVRGELLARTIREGNELAAILKASARTARTRAETAS